ncbi:hypothetical protein RQP46_000746 [Phenoliferia psychrophenolica]
MSFAGKVLTGGLVAGGLSFFYQAQIESTTAQLSADLHDLSNRLTSLVPATAAPASYPTDVPRRLPFSEQLKARWNEKLAYGLQSVQEADLAAIAAATYAKGKALLPAADTVKEEAKP